MEIWLCVVLFLLGLLFGSFYNVVGLRVPQKKSIVFPRSHCPSCSRTLSERDLIPVLSYLLLKGKCRACGYKISPIYPLMELLTGVLFAVSPVFVGWNPELIISLLFISLLIIITVSDLAYMIIPNKVLLVFGILFALLRVFIPIGSIVNAYIGSVVGFGLLLFIAIISRGGMGGGDVKLFAVLGLVLGWKLVLLAFFFATFLGMIYGIIGLLTGIVKRGEPIPFGPHIALGALMAYFIGESVLRAYFSLY
ncbi:prepilin peptidase [Bacillus tianshenii]|nr:prepilin peptidase [Bacillus tianshenii]